MYQEEIRPLLRPNQVEAYEEDVRRLRKELNAPDYIRSQIQDVGAKRKQLQQLERDLETQRPQVYSTDVRDDVVKRHNQLLEEVTQGMPTQAEMRRRPPGAVDKYVGWTQRNKTKVLELKNIRLRMHASGMIDGVGDAGEVANLERFRPVGGSQEMSMDGALIPGKDIHLPPPGAAPTRVMSDEHKALLQEVAPDLADQMATIDNGTRGEIIDRLDAILAAQAALPPSPMPPKKRAPNEWDRIRMEAKSLGIKTHGKTREQIEAEIAEADARNHIPVEAEGGHRDRGSVGQDAA